jgi:integrase/recombinase XerD
VQAQAGHRSIESTRIYLHLANGWLAEEYSRALSAIEHDTGEQPPEPAGER